MLQKGEGYPSLLVLARSEQINIIFHHYWNKLELTNKPAMSTRTWIFLFWVSEN